MKSRRVFFGNILQPDECWMLDGRLPTVSLRMNRASKNAQRIADAVRIARTADVIVAVIGTNESTSREAYADNHLGDMATLALTAIAGIGLNILLGLAGQVSFGHVGFYAIGAYTVAILAVTLKLSVWIALPIAVALSGLVGALLALPALRVKGLMLVIATLAFGEGVRLFFFNFDYQIARGDIKVGPLGGEGFRQIRFFPEHGWTTGEVMLFIWLFVAAAMALLWWFDRSRYGSVLRAVGEDELAAQSVGINVTAVKVSAMTVGGAIAGVGGGLYAHYTTHIEHTSFNILLATFAIACVVGPGMGSASSKNAASSV